MPPRSFLLSLIYILFTLSAIAQSTTDRYLETHKYSIDLRTTHPDALDTLFKKKLPAFKALFLGEGGSHELDFYSPLALYLLQHLNRSLGVSHFAFEFGSSMAFTLNKYLATGDTAWLPHFRDSAAAGFWRSLRLYNQSTGNNNPLYAIGIDFERAPFYLQALKDLMPANPSPATIQPFADLIRNTPDKITCHQLTELDRTLKHNLTANQSSFQSWLGEKYPAFHYIISNPGSCKDVLRNRNGHLLERFEFFDSFFHDSLYYAELGEAHVNFRLKNASYALNNDKNSPFFHRVAVINVFCYQCNVWNKNVSNWDFGNKLEKIILDRIIPHCKDSFTFFDLLETDDPALLPIKDCGQFLLVVNGRPG